MWSSACPASPTTSSTALQSRLLRSDLAFAELGILLLSFLHSDALASITASCMNQRDATALKRTMEDEEVSNARAPTKRSKFGEKVDCVVVSSE